MCVCVSLHHLHLNAYSPLTFLQLDGLKWCLASANTHISIHTLTQEATALITDHTRKVCHYFKCRKFFKVHELWKSAFGQNSVSCLKGILPCACGFFRFEIQLHVGSYFRIAILAVKARFEILLSPALFFSLRRQRTSLIACLCCCHACRHSHARSSGESRIPASRDRVCVLSSGQSRQCLFTHDFLSRLFPLAPPNPWPFFLSVEMMGNLSQVVF